MRIAGNSRPGPDGIPFKAWRRLGPLGVEILFQAGRRLEEGLDPGNPVHNRFNEALLCCLPKATSRRDDLGNDCHRADETRPLSIANTDNRLVASAFRLLWEPLVEPSISQRQRGFLRGRSMLRHVVELESQAMVTALEEEDGAILLFDFRAAFPSVSRDFLMASLERAGFPPSALAVVRALYLNTTAHVVLHGALHGEITMERGIRQGCPSPHSYSPLPWTHSFATSITYTLTRSAPYTKLAVMTSALSSAI